MLTLAGVLLAVPVRAQDAPAADSAAVADTSAIVVTGEAVRDAGAVRREADRQGILSEPRWVMTRSLLFPGWGQAYNDAWVKAGLVAGTEAYLIVRLVDDHRALVDLEAAAEEALASGDEDAERLATEAYNDRLDAFVRRQWFLGAVVVYAMVDAYVDAHFRNFDVDFENDPALPGGAPGAPGGRLLLRWRF